MALGNEIVLSPEPRGRRIGGIIEGALKPGTAVQVKAGTEPVHGRLTWQAWDKSGSGFPGLVAILDFDGEQGKKATDALVSGDDCIIYIPLPGDEMNVLVGDISGTAATSDFAIGDLLMIQDGTGLFIDALPGTASNLSWPAQVMQTYADMVGDTLIHVIMTGH